MLKEACQLVIVNSLARQLVRPAAVPAEPAKSTDPAEYIEPAHDQHKSW